MTTLQQRAITANTKEPRFRRLCLTAWDQMSDDQKRSYQHTFGSFLESEQMKVAVSQVGPSWRATGPGKFTLKQEARS